MGITSVSYNTDNDSKYFTGKQLEQLQKKQAKSQSIDETGNQENKSDSGEMEYITE